LAAITPGSVRHSIKPDLTNGERAPEKIVTKQHYNQQHKETSRVNRAALFSLFSTSFVTMQHYN